jgi:hypothetical protein
VTIAHYIELNEWFPIETAPKGEFVWVRDDVNLYQAKWTDDGWVRYQPGELFVPTHWCSSPISVSQGVSAFASAGIERPAPDHWKASVEAWQRAVFGTAPSLSVIKHLTAANAEARRNLRRTT